MVLISQLQFQFEYITPHIHREGGVREAANSAEGCVRRITAGSTGYELINGVGGEGVGGGGVLLLELDELLPCVDNDGRPCGVFFWKDTSVGKEGVDKRGGQSFENKPFRLVLIKVSRMQAMANDGACDVTDSNSRQLESAVQCGVSCC